MKSLFIATLSVFIFTSCSFAKTFAPEHYEPNKIFTEQLFKIFNTWMKSYNHNGLTNSESFAEFPTSDDCLLNYGADYSDYLHLADIANKNGYKITFTIKESGYYYQLKQARNRDEDFVIPQMSITWQ